MLGASLMEVCGEGSPHVTLATSSPRESPRPSPSAKKGALWVKGRWEYRGSRWVWRTGEWVKPRTGYVWFNGNWERHGGRWHWVEGHWRTERRATAERNADTETATLTP